MDRRIDPEDWPEAIADHTGPQLVVAGPGAGKTEFLVRRTLHLVDEVGVHPERILLLSFSRRSAADLRSRVEDGLDRSFTSVAASTFHSLAHRLLETTAPGAMPSLLTGPEQVALVHELLSEEDPASWPVPFRDLLPTQTFAREVTDFLLRCREQLLEPDDVDRLAADRADWRGLPGFLRRYDAALERQRRIDYGTLQARAVAVLADPAVAESLAEAFAYVLVDEYQDTTAAQAQLLQRLYRPHRNLTVAGDPYQSIYSFRGADLGNIAEFPGRFPDAGGDPARRLVLTTSFRVPAPILEAAVRVTAGGDLPGAAGPVRPGPGPASVETYGFDQASHEAAWIAAEVQRMHYAEAIPYRAMAVLVRTKRRFLPELSRALDRHRIPHDPPDARLFDHPAIRMVLDCVTAATGVGPDAEAALRRILLGPLFTLSVGAFRDLLRRQATGRDGWDALLTEGVAGGAELAALLADTSWATDRPAADGFWHLWQHLPHLDDLVADPARAEERAAWSSLSQVLARLRERNPAATLVDYAALSEEEFEATPLLGYRPPGQDRLTLTTLHQAKGLEFEAVFIADAAEGVFPDLRPRESLLGSRHLSSRATDHSAYRQFRLQEEMRLAYTAMCRARRRVVWTATAAGAEEGEGAPSRFLALVAGTGTVAEAARPPGGEERAPATPLEAEAWLRRLARDPARPEPDRLAAVAALARGQEFGLRPAEGFAGVRERGPDTGLVTPGLPMSPSQIELYADCPRRYAFERRLHVGDTSSVYLAFGSLIHDVLEEVETAARDRGDPHATVDEALAAMDARFEPALFGGGSWATAWHRRAVAALEFLYALWPGKGRAVALEQDLSLDVGGVRWRGRADRIEARGDGLYVVDYKTGSKQLTIAEAAVSIQLAFYLLAAAADPGLATLGPVVGAELWYTSPGSNRKSVATRLLDPARVDEARAAMEDAAAGIAAERWDPQPGASCERCRVKLVCPAWPEGREAFAT